MAEGSYDLVALERERLARALREAAQPATATPRKRPLKGLRKMSGIVERTWVSAGCFGEVIQWRLKPRKGP